MKCLCGCGREVPESKGKKPKRFFSRQCSNKYNRMMKSSKIKKSPEEIIKSETEIKKASISISPSLIKSREKTHASSMVAPSGFRMAWDESNKQRPKGVIPNYTLEGIEPDLPADYEEVMKGLPSALRITKDSPDWKKAPEYFARIRHLKYTSLDELRKSGIFIPCWRFEMEEK